MEIKIDEELRALIPPLSEDERKQLEANLIQNGGARDPIVVWFDGQSHVIVDGHNRFEICSRLGLEFHCVTMQFASSEEAKVWMIDNQKGRRNLTDGWKWELAQAKKKILGDKGEERQAHGQTAPGKTLLSKVDKSVAHNTQKELAKDLGWSTGKVAMADKVWKDAMPEVKEKVKTGEVSINQAYQDIRKEEKKQKAQDALHARNDDKARKTAKLKNSLFNVRRGDFREVLADVEAASLILTDPPYPKGDLPLWSDLGEWASNALADDGILVAYSGQMYLPQVLANLGEHLEYWWCGAVVHKGSGNLSPLGHPVRKVINQWKPLVMFYKRGGIGFDRTFRDLVMGVGPEKTDHNWQQPVEEAKLIIEAFTNPGELVVDPFAGSGGFCKAAEELGRLAVGAEILDA
jgi:ParB-like chromosome segregation protein Spo0J